MIDNRCNVAAVGTFLFYLTALQLAELFSSLFAYCKLAVIDSTLAFNSSIFSCMNWRYFLCSGFPLWIRNSCFKVVELGKYEGWRMVLQKLWVSQNFSRISRVSQSRFFSGYVHLAVSFFIRRCLGVSIFCKAKGLEVPIRLFVFLKWRQENSKVYWLLTDFQIWCNKTLWSLGLAKKNASLAVSQSLAFTIRHP